MENFEEVYSIMMNNYNQIEVILGSLYDSNNMDQFYQISEIAKMNLESLLALINNFCPNEMKETCIKQIENKEATLSRTLENVMGKAL